MGGVVSAALASFQTNGNNMQNQPFNRANAKPLSFQIRNDAHGVELLILDPIGDTFGDSTASDVAALLKKHRGKPVHVRINSPGGFAFEGIAIHNILLSHAGKVTVTIEGVAASAAAIVAMAGDTIRIFENATLMIHRGWQMSIGNIEDHAETINILRRLDDQLATTIATRRGISKSRIVKLMIGESDGTWFSAAEAKAAGLVDEITPLGKAKKRKPGDREQEARARRLRMMELDGHKWESENAGRRGGPDAVARERRLAEIAGHAREFATS